ncbi:MAG: RsmB/NOP family class I SAM-dependent RNA methyltransferase [Pseudomonadota bacterium]
MRDGPRWQTIIDLLHNILQQNIPADLAIRRWSKAARFAGSKDRRFIGDTLFDLCRNLSALQWRLEAAGGEPHNTRQLALAHLGADAAPLFDGSSHAPAPMDEIEQALIEKLADLHDDIPEEARLGVPDWAVTGLKASFGDSWQAEALASQTPASVDLRLRDFKQDRDDLLKALGARGLDVEPTPYSPIGLRLQGRFAAGELPELNAGELEIQDEASQLAALLVGAAPKMQVLDLCAGAGGKSLVFAASLRGQGQVLAIDKDEHRLREATKRAQRAKVPGLKTQHADALTAPDDVLRPGEWDRVLVDAPCSGSGTWRRAPDARWRMDSVQLSELIDVQAKLLDKAATLVKPGGMIAYVTCSLLAEENISQIERFLTDHDQFETPDFETIWTAVFEEQAAPSVTPQAHGWLFSPAQHGTDGFYMAMLRHKD